MIFMNIKVGKKAETPARIPFAMALVALLFGAILWILPNSTTERSISPRDIGIEEREVVHVTVRNLENRLPKSQTSQLQEAFQQISKLKWMVWEGATGLLNARLLISRKFFFEDSINQEKILMNVLLPRDEIAYSNFRKSDK